MLTTIVVFGASRVYLTESQYNLFKSSQNILTQIQSFLPGELQLFIVIIETFKDHFKKAML